MQIITLFSKPSLAAAVFLSFLSTVYCAPLYPGRLGGGFGGLGGDSGSGCGAYTIINTRGTGELQGPSAGFRTMTSQTLAQVPGGQTYSTVYSAGFSQISTAGTNDILRKIKQKLAQCPGHKFALLGYSQGASATTVALQKITDEATANAIKAVILIGNPNRKPGLQCNVDAQGGQSTRNARGLEAFFGGIPPQFVPKTIDICAFGDGVCDGGSFLGISIAHLQYPTNSWVQKRGAEIMIAVFRG